MDNPFGPFWSMPNYGALDSMGNALPPAPEPMQVKKPGIMSRMARGLFGEPDLSMYAGLLNPDQIAAMQKQARQERMLAMASSLLESGGPSTQRTNFGQALGRGLMAGQQAQGSALGQGLPMAFQLQAMQAKKAQDEQLRAALMSGDISSAAVLDPQAANAFRQATATPESKPTVVGRNDRLVQDGRVIVDALPMETKDSPKPEIKPIYALDGRALGAALIDTTSGIASVGNSQLGPGQYTTEKPDNARASPAALNLQNDLRDRLQKVSAAKAALARTKDALSNTRGVLFDTGPLDSALDWTPSNNAFNASVAQLSPYIRSLTKTPGEGSVSDYEQKLMQQALPSQSNYYSTNEQSIKNLEDTIAALEADYLKRLEQSNAVQQSGDWSVEPL